MNRKVSPKAHGAWLGGGTGTLVGSVVVGLIQSYITHKQLPPATLTLVMGICSSLAAFIGAHVMPLEYPLPYQSPAQPPAQPVSWTSQTSNVGGGSGEPGHDTPTGVIEGWGR